MIIKKGLITLLLSNSLIYGNSNIKKNANMSISSSEKESIISNSAFVMPSAGALAHSLQMIFHNMQWSRFIDTKRIYNIGKNNEERALNLGIRGADLFFLAISKNVDDLTKIARETNLILNKIIINRKSINTTSRKISLKKLEKEIKKKNWKIVLKKITILKENINIDFDDKNEEQLSLLNDIGSWMEGYRLTVEALYSNYKQEETTILFQSPLIEYLLRKLKSSTKLKEFSKREKIINLLTRIDKLLLNANDYQLSKQELLELLRVFHQESLI